MKKTIYLLVIALFTFSCENPLIDRVKNLATPSLYGNSVSVYYSMGYESKAKLSKENVENCIEYFRKKLSIDISPIYLSLLDENDFEKLSLSYPYGLPNVQGIQGNSPVIFLPANSKGIVATENKRIINADTAFANQIKMLGFESMDKAIDKSVDLIGFHELGHLFSQKLGIRPKIQDIFWMEEFVATYIAYCYFYENDNSSAFLMKLFGQSVLCSWQPNSTDLAEMLNNRKDVKVYSWYQAKLIVKASEIYEQHKLSLITTLQLQNSENDMVRKLSELINQDVNKW